MRTPKYARWVVFAILLFELAHVGLQEDWRMVAALSAIAVLLFRIFYLEDRVNKITAAVSLLSDFVRDCKRHFDERTQA